MKIEERREALKKEFEDLCNEEFETIELEIGIQSSLYESL